MKKILPLLIIVTLLFIPSNVFAKGPFSYLTIKGLDLTEDLNVTEPALLDFFTFADFFRGDVDTPANPGEGYEVIRWFIDSETNKVQNFDHLHYYPDTGYVYYDGIINGSSEYDGKWYIAHSEIQDIFHAQLTKPARINWMPFAALLILLAAFLAAYRNRSSILVHRQSLKADR